MSLDQIHLETSGKGEKIEKTEATKRLRDIEDVKTYLAKLSQTASSKNKNPLLQKQITSFLEKAANNGLGKNTEKYNAKKFDTDGEIGLDNFEFERFSEAMKGAITQIVAMDSVGAFDRIHSESQEGGSWSNPDKWLAEKVDVSKHILGEKGSSSFAEEALKKVGTISPEELHKIQEKQFSLSIDGIKDMSLLLAKEIGSGVEDLIRFLTNIPSGAVLLPRYLSYRVDSNSSDLQQKTEGEIKLAGLVESNSSLAIIELLGEKGIQMIKQLASMMKSGKQGDIATILVTLAGLIAGGAGAVKLASTLSRKAAIKSAREAGSAGRKAGEVMTRESRNTLRDVSRSAGKVTEIANKVDNIVSGNAAVGKVASVAGKGVRKVAPAFSVAANDASNVNEIERARAKKQEAQRVDAVANQELRATGTDGPISGPRMSVDNPFDGMSTESLQTQYELSRIITGQDSRLTSREGDLMREIQRRTNPNTPEPPRTPDKKAAPTTNEGSPSNVVDFAEKQARELGRFRDEILLSGSKQPLLYIERNGSIEIGRFLRMENGKALVEFIKDGKVVRKPHSLEDLAKLNDPEKRIHPSITREIQEKRGKMQQVYEKSGVSPLEIRNNSGLSHEDRIKKAEEIMGRTPDQWETLAIDYIHSYISKGIYNNSTADLMKMARKWEEMTGNKMSDKAKFAEFRKLVERGILGQDPEAIAIKDASKKATTDIGIYGVDFLLDKIKDRKLNQPQLNAVVFEYFDAHGPKTDGLDEFFRENLDIAGYIGDKEMMFQQAIVYAKEMKLDRTISEINTKPLQQTLDYIKAYPENIETVIAELIKNGNKQIKNDLLKQLESNRALCGIIMQSDSAKDFIKLLGDTPEHSSILIRDIIQNESLLKTMASEHLSAIEKILEKMIKENIYSGGLRETLRTTLALARDAKSPTNQIKYYLQNGDDAISAKLRAPFSGEKAIWNIMFDDLRIKDNGPMERLNMIKRGEKEFFWKGSLDTFFHFTFPDFPKDIQRAFIKEHVIPKNGKYHSLLEEFPIFEEKIREHGWL